MAYVLLGGENLNYPAELCNFCSFIISRLCVNRKGQKPLRLDLGLESFLNTQNIMPYHVILWKFDTRLYSIYTLSYDNSRLSRLIYAGGTLGKEDIISWPCSVIATCCNGCTTVNWNNYEIICTIWHASYSSGMVCPTRNSKISLRPIIFLQLIVRYMITRREREHHEHSEVTMSEICEAYDGWGKTDLDCPSKAW